MSTMVDSKVVKTMQRSVGRAKEKILQNLGKVDRTADEIFDDHVGNFNKQQCAATRLQKELNNYIRCIRACASANRALLEAVGEVYEPEWGGRELLNINAQSTEMLWNDFAHRLAEQVLIPLNTYQGQFPETRKKIEKRGRKLVDYDGERHNLQALQSNPRRPEAKLERQRENLEAAKRTYEVLNSELHDELPSLYASRIVFLVSAMSTLFAAENIFHSESSKVYGELEGIVERLSKESAKGTLSYKAPSTAVLNNSSDSPKEDVKNGLMSSSSSATQSVSNHKSSNVCPPPAITTTSATPTPPSSKSEEPSMSNGDLQEHSYVNVEKKSEKMSEPPAVVAEVTPEVNGIIEETPPASATMEMATAADATTTNIGNGDHHDEAKKKLDETEVVAAAPPAVNGDAAPVVSSESATKETDNHTESPASETSPETPVEATPEHKSPSSVEVVPPPHTKNNSKLDKNGTSEEPVAPAPVVADPTSSNTTTTNNNSNSSTTPNPEKDNPGVLYRVRATYRYQKEDVDELSFEAGEVINVIEFDDPEDQEEGWLMGYKENGEKGLFPANFTRQV